jgi:23S rRNA (uracil-5-)-methyltransferase RumA
MATPLCAYFGNCGGCSAQHIDYEIQLENKRKVLANSIEYNTIQVFSGKQYNYRNRMDFIFHPNGLGLRMKKQWQHIVDIEECKIANEKLNMLLKEVRIFFKKADYFDIHKQTGTLRYCIIRTPSKSSSISFVLNPKSPKLGEVIEQIKVFAATTTAENILVTYVEPNTEQSISQDYFTVKGSDLLHEVFLNKTFYYSAQGFFQNNDELVEKMLHYCHDRLSAYPTKDAHLLDLYGGVGTFGITSADLFKGTTIVESAKLSIDAAQKNIQENNLKNCQAVVLDAQHLKKLKLPSPLYIITDPPRSGMHPKTIEILKKIAPEVIIYISCNVQQLAKDILKFKKYEIKSAALFDLFPQTPHSEAIVELKRIE